MNATTYKQLLLTNNFEALDKARYAILKADKLADKTLYATNDLELFTLLNEVKNELDLLELVIIETISKIKHTTFIME